MGEGTIVDDGTKNLAGQSFSATGAIGAFFTIFIVRTDQSFNIPKSFPDNVLDYEAPMVLLNIGSWKTIPQIVKEHVQGSNHSGFWTNLNSGSSHLRF